MSSSTAEIDTLDYCKTVDHIISSLRVGLMFLRKLEQENQNKVPVKIDKNLNLAIKQIYDTIDQYVKQQHEYRKQQSELQPVAGSTSVSADDADGENREPADGGTPPAECESELLE